MEPPERYTLWRAAAEHADELALVMVLAAIICVCLAVLGCPVIVNAAITGLFGPVDVAALVVKYWRGHR